jgi:hypothetical protein
LPIADVTVGHIQPGFPMSLYAFAFSPLYLFWQEYFGDFLIDRHPALENVWLVDGGSGHGFKHRASDRRACGGVDIRRH